MTTAPPSPTHALLGHLLTGDPLSEAQAQQVFTDLLTGRMDEAQIGSLLTLLARRGPTIDELVGAARVMRAHVRPVAAPLPGVPILDTCGTGGAPKLFNVSTLSAIVTAAAAPGRIQVAKHGNRSRTGRGSAELLEALGVGISAPCEVQTRCLREIGLCFSFAPDHHPAAKYASGPRKSLGFPTIFNLLGPLVNPAGATHQIVGTYSPDNALKLAHALARLGTQRAMVFTSHDGLDELTTTAPNIVHHISPRGVESTELDASTLGLPCARIDQLQATTLDQAVAIARDILAAKPGPHTDLVLLSSAASLHIAGAARDLPDGRSLARQALASGAAKRTLDQLIALTNSPQTDS